MLACSINVNSSVYGVGSCQVLECLTGVTQDFASYCGPMITHSVVPIVVCWILILAVFVAFLAASAIETVNPGIDFKSDTADLSSWCTLMQIRTRPTGP